MSRGLRAYIGHSRVGGAHEGAVLIFAHDSREAKRVGLRSVLSDITDGDYLDVAIRWLRDPAVFRYADPAKMATGVPHVNDNPQGCAVCGYWYVEAYDEHGRCESCAEAEQDFGMPTPTSETNVAQTEEEG